MIPLLPYRRVEIVSPHSPDALAQRINAVTSPGRPWLRSLPGNFHFTGRVSSAAFYLVPVIRGRNTYLPHVRGVIHDTSGGTRIQLVQTLHPIAIAFVIGLCFVLPLIFGASAGMALLVLFVFHSLMYFVGFLPEAERTEERIRALAA